MNHRRRLMASLAERDAQLAKVHAEHGAKNMKRNAELAAAWQRLTAQAQQLGVLSPGRGRARSFSPGCGASA
jgi:hypothetical protein